VFRVGPGRAKALRLGVGGSDVYKGHFPLGAPPWFPMTLWVKMCVCLSWDGSNDALWCVRLGDDVDEPGCFTTTAMCLPCFMSATLLRGHLVLQSCVFLGCLADFV
jgi:hypothetical protein